MNKKIDIKLNISAEQFKKKLGLENGQPGAPGKTPKKGEDYLTDKEVKEFKSEIIEKVSGEIPKHVKKEVDKVIDFEKIAERINEAVNNRKVQASEVAGLEDMFKEELDKVYENITAYIKETQSKRGGSTEQKKISGGGSLNIQSFKDIDFSRLTDGSILRFDLEKQEFYFTNGDLDLNTNNLKAGTVTQISSPTFTYTLGKLTKIEYENGTEKNLTYNGDGTLNTMVITYSDMPTVTKTFNWSAGVLQSISII